MVFRDVDEIAEDVYRRSAARLSELRAANQRMAAENRALTERTAERIRQAVEKADKESRQAGRRLDEPAPAAGDQQFSEAANDIRVTDERRDQWSTAACPAAVPRTGTTAAPVGETGTQGGSAGAAVDPAELDPREAIARAAAARRRNSVVAPIDDNGDDEGEYYRRKSWLV